MGKFDNHNQNLYEDSSEEEKLMKLPEMEREKILYKRYMQYEKIKEEKEMKDRINKLRGVDPQEPESHEDQTITYEILCENVIKRDILVKNIYRPAFDKITGNYVRIAYRDGYSIKKS